MVIRVRNMSFQFIYSIQYTICLVRVHFGILKSEHSVHNTRFSYIGTTTYAHLSQASSALSIH